MILVGRQEAEREAIRLLSSGSGVWIVGPPGIGKTALATAILKTLPASMQVDFVDGADDLASQATTRTTPGAHPVLLTSCRTPPAPQVPVLSLGALDVEDAVTMLLGGDAGLVHRDAAVQIAKAVEGEPLGLALARNLAARIGWSVLAQRVGDGGLLRRELHAGQPWAEPIVTKHVEALSASARDALGVVASVAHPFTFDVLEALGGDALEIVTELLAAGLLVFCPRGVVLGYRVPWTVRTALRPDGHAVVSAALVQAWATRGETLLARSYGRDAAASLVEASFALPVAAQALTSCIAVAQAIELWIAVADALFFEDAGAIDDQAVACAVTLADAHAGPGSRVRARLVLSRSLLERGEPEAALRASEEAEARLPQDASVPLRAECLRRKAWAQLASGLVDDAQTTFKRAQTLAEGALDLRGEADARSGLGMSALLNGRANEAGEHLEAALAIHAVARDAPRQAAVRGMMELLPNAWRGTIDVEARLATLEGELGRAQQEDNGVRQALAMARLGLAARERGDVQVSDQRFREARVALRMAGFDAVSPFVEPWGMPEKQDDPRAILRLSEDGDRVTLPDGTTRDLSRHGAQKRLLVLLAHARCDRPGIALNTEELLRAGWPGEKMLHDAGLLRVYTSIRRLRKLGLDTCLRTRDDGYLLDVDIDVVWQPS